MTGGRHRPSLVAKCMGFWGILENHQRGRYEEMGDSGLEKQQNVQRSKNVKCMQEHIDLFAIYYMILDQIRL